MGSLLKPWFIWRPTQIFSRLRYREGGVRPTAQNFLTAWGATLKGDPRQLVGRSVLTTGVFDLAVTEMLLRLIDPGTRVVDIGANIGYMTTLMARRASPGGKLTAFEPHPEIYQRLQENLRLNASSIQLSELRLVNAAVGAKAGEATLVCPSDFQSNGGTAYLSETVATGQPALTVTTTTLDEMFPEETLDVVKLDVEGHEAAVLEGGKWLFKEQRVRHLVFEEHAGPDSAVCRTLRECGYELRRIGWTWNKLRFAELSDPPIHEPYEAPSFLATTDLTEVLTRCRAPGWQCLRGSA